MVAVRKLKTAVYALAVVVLVLACVVLFKLAFVPDTPAYADDMPAGRYQMSCAGVGDDMKCVVLDTAYGEIEELYTMNGKECKKEDGINYWFWCK